MRFPELFFVFCLVAIYFTKQSVNCKDDGSESDTNLQHANAPFHENVNLDSDVKIMDDFHKICGVVCHCDFNKQRNLSVICENEDLLQIPHQLPMGTTILIYTKNQVPNNTVTKNFMTTSKQRSIIHLDLSYNSIHLISANAFEEYVSLLVLNLNGNPISSRSRSFLEPIRFNLMRLHLSGIRENQKEPFPWQIFSTIPKVRTNDPPCDHVIKFSNLEIVQLTDNYISEINNTVVACLSCLKTSILFDLSKNFIKDYNLQSFLLEIKSFTKLCNKTYQMDKKETRRAHAIFHHKRMKTLLKFNFTQNKIQQLSSKTLSYVNKERGNTTGPEYKLQMLIGNNPFQCICSIGSLEKFLHIKPSIGIILDRRNIKCDYPKVLKGLKVSELDVLHINYCSGDWHTGISLKTTQLVFIIIFSSALLLVAMSVGYLHRAKCFHHWQLMCNRDEDSSWTRKRRDKYAIPKDYLTSNKTPSYLPEDTKFIPS